MKQLKYSVLIIMGLSILMSLSACSSGGGGSGYRSHVSYGVGYGGYYGDRPWGYHPGYVGGGIGGIDPDYDRGPVAEHPLCRGGRPGEWCRRSWTRTRLVAGPTE